MKFPILSLFFAAALFTGCGGQTPVTDPTPTTGECAIRAILVGPETATVDHNGAPPLGNSQQFQAFITDAGPGCIFQWESMQNVTWTLSDNVNAGISNSHDNSNLDFGRATCLHAAPAPITVTATVTNSTVKATGTLNCN